MSNHHWLIGDCASSSPWNLELLKFFFVSFDWGITPQVPHWNLNHGNISLGSTPSVPHEIWISSAKGFLGSCHWLGDYSLVPHWGGFQFIGFMHCILPTKIFIVCLNISKGKTLCIIPISKAWICTLFHGLRVASLPLLLYLENEERSDSEMEIYTEMREKEKSNEYILIHIASWVVQFVLAHCQSSSFYSFLKPSGSTTHLVAWTLPSNSPQA